MLDLRFSTRAGRAQLSSSEDRVENLHALRSRFSTATTIDRLAFDLELDDLLVNLHELARWPADDTDVRWQPDILGLVEGNAADAATLRIRLENPVEGESQTVDVGPIGDEWIASFTDFQRADLAKLLGLNHGANFSVPGAGKTRVALAVFQARRVAGEVERLLVVCPKAAFESWVNEVALCFRPPTPTIGTMDGPHPPDTQIVLINYERLPDAKPALLGWLAAAPAMLVLDEAHRTKRGPGGVWGATTLALGPYAKRRLILSGTPAPNGVKDLENLFGFVWPGQGRLQVSRALDGGDLKRASQLLKPLFVRTTKRQLDLPPVDLRLRSIALPPLHRELYDALVGQLAGSFRGGTGDIEALGRVLLYLVMGATTPALLAAGSSRYEPLPYRLPPLDPPTGSTLSELMRDLPHYEMSPKYQEVLSIVAANAAAGRKTLVWSTFVRNLTSLGLLLEQFNPALVHGGTPDRDEQLAKFRTDDSCFVLLSNPATLGEGVSLHRVCHDAVYVDRDFSAGRFLQSLDRIHRLGLAPEAATQITVLLAAETIDELIEQRLAMKLQFLGGVLDDPAVVQLSDLEEEPAISAGMGAADVAALIGYLRGSPTA